MTYNPHNGTHAEPRRKSWARKSLAGIPLVVLAPVLVAGIALAGWALQNNVLFGGNASTEAAQTDGVTLTSVSAVVDDRGTTSSAVCSATFISPASFDISATGFDVDYSGDDSGDDRCLVTATVNIAPGRYLNGVGLNTDESAFINDPNAPFFLEPVSYENGGGTIASDFCETGVTGSPIILKFYVSVSELNSSPASPSGLSGSYIATAPDGSGDPCVSAGL